MKRQGGGRRGGERVWHKLLVQYVFAREVRFKGVRLRGGTVFALADPSCVTGGPRLLTFQFTYSIARLGGGGTWNGNI
jgi:hypothetical protein